VEARASFVTPLEVLVPLKGEPPDKGIALESLLKQNHSSYRVAFILESDSDPARHLVDRLCSSYPHARTLISGVSTTCSQKNHNLVAGVKSLNPETQIIVFCDSTNIAEPDWLMEFTQPFKSPAIEVVTTFRAFDPEPETFGGVCQAQYASFVILLIALMPKPWGGASAIRRETFERLGVAATWSRTVVDDLVLGNILHSAGIGVQFQPHCILRSPLANQSVRGFLNYLDRQILFPKFTNPGIWVLTLLCHTSVTLAIFVTALTGLVLFPAGLVGSVAALVCYGFLGLTVISALALWASQPSSISLTRWLKYFYPAILLGAFIYFRSVFRNHITWHGRRYRTGRRGIVFETNLNAPGSGSCL
jgi:cellulose synthase/poly-beta-1,6-N-acetylglucosamine synthase-like glycosyltransferase